MVCHRQREPHSPADTRVPLLRAGDRLGGIVKECESDFCERQQRTLNVLSECERQWDFKCCFCHGRDTECRAGCDIHSSAVRGRGPVVRAGLRPRRPRRHRPRRPHRRQRLRAAVCACVARPSPWRPRTRSWQILKALHRQPGGSGCAGGCRHRLLPGVSVRVRGACFGCTQPLGVSHPHMAHQQRTPHLCLQHGGHRRGQIRRRGARAQIQGDHELQNIASSTPQHVGAAHHHLMPHPPVEPLARIPALRARLGHPRASGSGRGRPHPRLASRCGGGHPLPHPPSGFSRTPALLAPLAEAVALLQRVGDCASVHRRLDVPAPRPNPLDLHRPQDVNWPRRPPLRRHQVSTHSPPGDRLLLLPLGTIHDDIYRPRRRCRRLRT